MAAALKAVEQGARHADRARHHRRHLRQCRLRAVQDHDPCRPHRPPAPGSPFDAGIAALASTIQRSALLAQQQAASMNCATPNTKASWMATRPLPCCWLRPLQGQPRLGRATERGLRARGGVRPLPDRHRCQSAIPPILGLKDTPYWTSTEALASDTFPNAWP
jgi:mercuric reductase